MGKAKYKSNKYRIEYNYDTGDTFRTEEDLTSELEFEWENLDIAKENLKRIKEHYEWYSSKESYRKKDMDPPSWWNCDSGTSMKNMEHYLINLKMDNGKEVQIHAPWCGYFETLNSAKIIQEGSDMEFSLD